MRLRAIGNKVIVEKIPEKEVTDGGIVLTEQTQKLFKPVKGIVKAVGPGKYLENGQLVDPELTIGDVVLFGGNAGEELEVDNEKFVVMEADEGIELVLSCGSLANGLCNFLGI